MNEKSVTLYLIRHGEAKSNVLGLLTSYPEKTPRSLTERGREQIQKTALELQNRDIAAIIASPLTRTQESGAIIGGALGLPVFTDIRLRETGFGAFDNTSVDDFFHKYPTDASREITDGSDGVESFHDIKTRVESLLRDVVLHYAGKSVVLVSHGDTLTAIYELTRATPYWSPALGEVKELTYSTEAFQGG